MTIIWFMFMLISWCELENWSIDVWKLVLKKKWLMDKCQIKKVVNYQTFTVNFPIFKTLIMIIIKIIIIIKKVIIIKITLIITLLLNLINVRV